MDRNFYYQNRTKEHQQEISQELANRNLLRSVKQEPLSLAQARELLIRFAPVIIVVGILLFLTILN